MRKRYITVIQRYKIFLDIRFEKLDFSSEIERVTEDVGAHRFGGGIGGGPMWAEIEGRGLTMACVGKPANFEIGGRGLNVDDIEVRITGEY